jgi:hypothetical protein
MVLRVVERVVGCGDQGTGIAERLEVGRRVIGDPVPPGPEEVAFEVQEQDGDKRQIVCGEFFGCWTSGT